MYFYVCNCTNVIFSVPINKIHLHQLVLVIYPGNKKTVLGVCAFIYNTIYIYK